MIPQAAAPHINSNHNPEAIENQAFSKCNGSKEQYIHSLGRIVHAIKAKARDPKLTNQQGEMELRSPLHF